MAEPKVDSPNFWLSSTDGEPVDPALAAAAERVWSRARIIVIRYLGEDTDVAEILETVVRAVAQTHKKNEIRYFDAYLLRSVAHEAVRRKQKNSRITYVDSQVLERLAGGVQPDLSQALDDEKQLTLFYACLDEKGRSMFDFRCLDYSWKEIAIALDYADAHTAEVQFGKKINAALRRMRGSQSEPEKVQRPRIHIDEKD